MTRFAMVISALCAPAACLAHSASDAYLTLSIDAPGNSHSGAIHGQWDIALRDLDFVLKLDTDGDGQVTWGELKRQQSTIERYAYQKLEFSDDSGNRCSIKPIRQEVDGHADGAYAVLFFDVVCARPPHALTMNYTLFFKIDPSHRGIFVMHSGVDASTAVLSPQNTQVVLPLKP